MTKLQSDRVAEEYRKQSKVAGKSNGNNNGEGKNAGWKPAVQAAEGES